MSDEAISAPEKHGQAEVVLDPSLYTPTPEEVAFMKKWTNIDDEEELKNHVIAVQKEAWDVVHYGCIQSFGFLKLKISRHPKYKELIDLPKTNPSAILLDFACCFGNDIRKAILDGYPQQNCVASDLEADFWNLGHRLFRTTPSSFKVPFIQGSVFAPALIAPAPVSYQDTPPAATRPSDLTSLTSLTPLQGHISAIHVSAFFHLFGREEQIAAAHALASLLSPEPGAMIFGIHSSRATSGERVNSVRNVKIYDFSPENWIRLWDGAVFEKGTVVVDVEMRNRERPRAAGVDTKLMVWSVKRV